MSIPLSEAEQASFLSKYGSQIQDVVTTGFQKVEKTLNRLLFLTESRDSLCQLTFRFVLKKSYLASEIAHFRSFIFLTLREGRPDMLIIWFGSSDGANRFRDDVSDAEKEATSGISSGICTSQWEKYTPPPSEHESSKTNLTGFDKNPLEYKQTSCWSGDGHDTVSDLFARYLHGGTRRIKFPRLSLRDLNDGIFLPFVNASLAEKIHSIQIFANGYKLEDLGPNEFKIDRSSFGVTLPGGFTDEELNDPWVRLRPTTFNSAYHFRFGGTTPRRIYDHEEPSDSPLPPELDKR